MKFFSTQPTLKQCRNDIRTVLKLCSDSKLVDILDMCESGKMRYVDTCHCLVGLLSENGNNHDNCQRSNALGYVGCSNHWVKAIKDKDFDKADHAYRILGYPIGSRDHGRWAGAANKLTQQRRDTELAALLREEMSLRSIAHERSLTHDSTPVVQSVRNS
jgi:hypothetical protein